MLKLSPDRLWLPTVSMTKKVSRWDTFQRGRKIREATSNFSKILGLVQHIFEVLKILSHKMSANLFRNLVLIKWTQKLPFCIETRKTQKILRNPRKFLENYSQNSRKILGKILESLGKFSNNSRKILEALENSRTLNQPIWNEVSIF